MNRLSNYFRSKELVNLQLGSAGSLLKAGKTDKAIERLISAVKEVLIAQNNMVSLVFEKKRKNGIREKRTQRN